MVVIVFTSCGQKVPSSSKKASSWSRGAASCPQGVDRWSIAVARSPERATACPQGVDRWSCDVDPSSITVESAVNRYLELARGRFDFFAQQNEPWWMEVVPFFDVERQRIWIFWRRMLHTAHHRTQLTVYLKMLDRKVPSTYGPTADVTWTGADPTYSVEAAGRG